MGPNWQCTVDTARIIHEIDHSPLNRGLKGIDWVNTPGNVALFHGDDLALFDYTAPGRYEGHFFFVSRGKEAVEVAKILTQRMFDEFDALLIIGYVPVINPKARVIARMAGYHYAGLKQTVHGPVYVYLIAPETH